MEKFFSFISFTISLIILIRSIQACSRINESKQFLNERHIQISSVQKKRSFYIIIPVLREQNIIIETLNFFFEIFQQNSSNITFYLIVAGTAKEKFDKENFIIHLKDIYALYKKNANYQLIKKRFQGILSDNTIEQIINSENTISLSTLQKLYNSQPSSGDLVKKWLVDNKDSLGKAKRINILYIECPNQNGNRSSQINYAIQQLRYQMSKEDIIGIYDADSRPEIQTFDYIASNLSSNINCFQQPLHYLDAVNKFVNENKSPIINAYALYQTTWSVIKEIPNFLLYMKHVSRYKNTSSYHQFKNSVYMFGHGEFLTVKLLDEIDGIPKNVSADGLQLGYRLSLINEPIKILPFFCSDDVPSKASTLITQHRRWYAGNIEYGFAHKWASNYLDKKIPKFSYIENIFLNINWALRPIIFISTLIISLYYIETPLFQMITLVSLVLSLLIYCYVTPYLSIKLIPIKVKVRFIDWIFLPIGIFLKSIGPWTFIIYLLLKRIFGFQFELKKVER